jgi:hypothetical protein
MELDYPMAKKKTEKTTRRTTKIQSSGTRKVTRRKRKTSHPNFDKSLVLDLDQVYRAINKVQLTRENVEFKVSIDDSAVIENILKDLELKFAKTLDGDAVVYVIDPPPVRTFDELDDLDEFSDEIIEDGQLF